MPQPTKEQREFNRGPRRDRRVRQRPRDWTIDPVTGRVDVSCGCGVSIIDYAGDPQVWATELHVCRFEAYSAWGGV
jgi:hypothetical protein